MKKLILIITIVLFVIYGGCAICVHFGWIDWLDWDVYFKIVAIAGGLASIFGLGAAAIKTDFNSQTAEALKELSKTAEEVSNKQSQLKDTSDRIAKLELRKEELEVLVKKASLSLYYQDELGRKYQDLLRYLNRHNEIQEMVSEIAQLESHVKDLNGEIEENPDIKVVLDTLQRAKQREQKKKTLIDALTSIPTIVIQRFI